MNIFKFCKKLINLSQLEIDLLLSKDNSINLNKIKKLYISWKKYKAATEEIQYSINQLSKNLSNLEDQNKVKKLKIELSELKIICKKTENELTESIVNTPNIPNTIVKKSNNVNAYEIIKIVNDKNILLEKQLPFDQLMNKLKMSIDASNIFGHGWNVYYGDGAILETNLLHFLLTQTIKSGFTPILCPNIVEEQRLINSGQLPKFLNQLFEIKNPTTNKKHFIIPTSEVTLCSIFENKKFKKQDLPIYVCSMSNCFRREAGSGGINTKGILRSHQFNKIEMFAISTPNEEINVINKLIENAEQILKKLNLHYRIIRLVSSDTPFASSITYDIEAWLPSQKQYVEISSISSCSDFQSIRSNISFKDEDNKNKNVYTYNGSSFATSRLLPCILEKYQTPNGDLILPYFLQ